MPHQVFAQTMKEINDLTLLAEKTLVELHHKTEELLELCRKHQGELPSPAFLSHPAKKQQPQK